MRQLDEVVPPKWLTHSLKASTVKLTSPYCAVTPKKTDNGRINNRNKNMGIPTRQHNNEEDDEEDEEERRLQQVDEASKEGNDAIH